MFEAEALSHLNHLYAAALRLTRDRPAAEDLVQDTYLKALRFSNRYARGSNLKAWLFTILHNTFRNTVRGAGRNPVEVDSEAVERAADGQPDAATPEHVLIQSTMDADLKAALDGLPDAYRTAVWLKDVEEFSYAEIAEMLDVPIGTVMSRLSRGRRLLHERLSQSRASDPSAAPVASGHRNTGERRES